MQLSENLKSIARDITNVALTFTQHIIPSYQKKEKIYNIYVYIRVQRKFFFLLL